MISHKGEESCNTDKIIQNYRREIIDFFKNYKSYDLTDFNIVNVGFVNSGVDGLGVLVQNQDLDGVEISTWSTLSIKLRIKIKRLADVFSEIYIPIPKISEYVESVTLYMATWIPKDKSLLRDNETYCAMLDRLNDKELRYSTDTSDVFYTPISVVDNPKTQNIKFFGGQDIILVNEPYVSFSIEVQLKKKCDIPYVNLKWIFLNQPNRILIMDQPGNSFSLRNK